MAVFPLALPTCSLGVSFHCAQRSVAQPLNHALSLCTAHCPFILNPPAPATLTISPATASSRLTYSHSYQLQINVTAHVRRDRFTKTNSFQRDEMYGSTWAAISGHSGMLRVLKAARPILFI